MQRKLNVLAAVSALLVLSSWVYADEAVPPVPTQVVSANSSSASSASANSAPASSENQGVAPFKIDPKYRPENLVPTSAVLQSGQVSYQRYCADCHGKEGEGKVGPKLVGSLMVTGPTYGHITVVLSGHPQSKMPTWGISEISDEVIASIITYQRNAWGNGNKKEYGKNAGGVVTPAQVHEYRKTLKNLPVKQDVRT